MMKNLLLLIPIALLAAGCSSGDGDRGDVAQAAAAVPPKSADALPKDMPPQARASAESAIKANNAMVAQQQAQMDAMVKATRGNR